MENQNPESTREELLTLVSETTHLIQGVQIQIDKLNEFYVANLIGEGDNLSNQTIFENLLIDVEKFEIETLIGTDENPSKKSIIENLLKDIEARQEEIVSAQKLLLENEEGRDSIKTQIINFKTQIEQFTTETFIDSDEKESTKSTLNNLITDANKLIADSTTLNSEIEVKHKEINSAQKLLLEDEEGRDSVKTQIIKIKEEFSKNLIENEKEVKKLSAFYKSVFEKTVDEETEKPGLKATVESLANRLEKLTSQAEKKLFELTDSSLQHAFTSRAKKYTFEFKKLQKFTFWLTLTLVADILLFGIIQLCKEKFDWHLLIYQFSIAGALIFSIFMYNRNQKIAKKLAEEYQHKASLTEAMTGYRALYNLEHTDAEYMELFNSLKEQLNTNPSKQIDTFLKLKSPHEEISNSIQGLLNPENIKAIAEQVKELMKHSNTSGQ